MGGQGETPRAGRLPLGPVQPPRTNDERYADRRQYVRHPIRLPLAVRPQNGAEEFRSRVGDLSEGGLSFVSPQSLALGGSVEVELPVQLTRFTLVGSVASCVQVKSHLFRVGLAFVDPGMGFKTKLAEQVLRIEVLRAALSQERGLEVSREEAAQVWVEQFAKDFADLFDAKH
jgi:c-di-GMP-binding flagellar brake protein YcgR